MADLFHFCGSKLDPEKLGLGCRPGWEYFHFVLGIILTRSGKPGKWEGIFQWGKSHGILIRLEMSGHFTQNTGKIKNLIN